MLYLILVSVLFFALGYFLAKHKQEDHVSFVYPEKSELADPTVNIPPTFFKWPHYDILEILSKYAPHECTRKQINYSLGKSSSHAYERELWLEGYVNRRVQKEKFWSTHFYTITQKGRDALVLYSSRF